MESTPSSPPAAPGQSLVPAGIPALKAAFVAEKSFALVGISATRGFANLAFVELRKRGYRVFPVGRGADTVAGERCYRSLAELPEPVGGVIIVVRPAEVPPILEECARLGIRRVWLQQGSQSEEALKLAEEKGLAVVQRACILMYTSPTGFHAFHAWLWKIFGKL